MKAILKFSVLMSLILLSLSQVYAAQTVDPSELFQKYQVNYENGTDQADTLNELNYVQHLPDQDYKSFTASVIRLVIGFTGTLCFISITISGILFVIARDDSELQGMAKKILQYSVYGVVIIGLSYSIVYGIARLDLD